MGVALPVGMLANAPGLGRSAWARVRWAWWLLVLVLGALAFILLRQWLYVGTYRFFVDERASGAGALQRFDLRDGRVEPQVFVTDDGRLSFPLESSLPSRLRLRAVPATRATLEIALLERGLRRTLYRRTLSEPVDIAQPLPPVRGLLEIATRGEFRLSDPRLVQEPVATPWLAALLACALVAALLSARAPPVLPRVRWARTLALGGVTGGIAVGLALAASEIALRSLDRRLPAWITLARRDLGEARADPRWQDSPRYGPRLAANVDTICEWQHGDIVRLGFLPPGLVRHPVYRFPLVTDAEGFRNAAPEVVAPEVAALGDSFTDALTLPAELTWPRLVAGRLGVGVRNYGTAGFGPAQQLLALKEYVLPRRPRLVVVAFFAGNDLQDAERFETWRRGGVTTALGLGWKFKRVVARFDRLYVMSLYQGFSSLLRDGSARLSRAAAPLTPEEYSGDDPAAPAPSAARFERGLFTLPVNGRALAFAFLPPYLSGLQPSREELLASRRFELTRISYREMARLVRAEGGELVVMFIPSKAQVYLPLLEAGFPAGELRQALSFCQRAQPHAPEADTLLRNRLALNQVMREFCAGEGIAFLDLTDELQARLHAGDNVYFPDDSHWNAAGHSVGAAALARFVRARQGQGAAAEPTAGRKNLQTAAGATPGRPASDRRLALHKEAQHPQHGAVGQEVHEQGGQVRQHELLRAHGRVRHQPAERTQERRRDQVEEARSASTSALGPGRPRSRAPPRWPSASAPRPLGGCLLGPPVWRRAPRRPRGPGHRLPRSP